MTDHALSEESERLLNDPVWQTLNGKPAHLRNRLAAIEHAAREQGRREGERIVRRLTTLIFQHANDTFEDRDAWARRVDAALAQSENTEASTQDELDNPMPMATYVSVPADIRPEESPAQAEARHQP